MHACPKFVMVWQYRSHIAEVPRSNDFYLPSLRVQGREGGRHPVLFTVLINHSCTVTGSEKVIGVDWHLLLTPLC
jgi:hypothetical protein